MPRNTLKFLALVLAMAGTALSQRPQPPDPATMVQHRVNFLTARLGLSTAQQQQATTIFTNAITGLQPFHDQMHAAHQALQAAVTKGDDAAIDQAAGTIGNLLAQETAAHAKAEAQFFQILTGDQQTKFTQMQSHGPGEFGFPPGFGHEAPPR